MAENTLLSARDNPRAASALDHEIGARLKLARQMAGLSQSQLAARVGVTFQQLQKYERGANRVPASRLFEFACVLERPLEFFFAGVDRSQPGASDTPLLTGFGHLSADVANAVLRALDQCPDEVRRSLVESILSAGRASEAPGQA